jgi:hypothetical protein
MTSVCYTVPGGTEEPNVAFSISRDKLGLQKIHSEDRTGVLVSYKTPHKLRDFRQVKVSIIYGLAGKLHV